MRCRILIEYKIYKLLKNNYPNYIYFDSLDGKNKKSLEHIVGGFILARQIITEWLERNYVEKIENLNKPEETRYKLTPTGIDNLSIFGRVKNFLSFILPFLKK